MSILESLLVIAGATVITIGVAILLVVPVFFAWNAVVPAVFGLPMITFTQAIFLSVLSSCLFKPSVPSKADIKSAIRDVRDGK